LKDKELQTTGKLSDDQARDLVLAWAVGSTSNSNTVTLVRDGQLIGNGVGQQDRVGGCELAIKRATDAGHDTKAAVAYSDSFFPFPDGPQALIDAGVSAILATSGSVRDSEIQEVCRKQKVILVQLPDAHARGFFGH
jgi:phosphoribosylaminoimidazolecarboxamide formyltransferase/IMP cyclohydrolase